mmetsp:Transcript_116944/g.364072  ORF Transcript_116944/g.364072 Transcript_116944/m.364072 type:complete len:543 (+) Transcript_116944:160-1788(+)
MGGADRGSETRQARNADRGSKKGIVAAGSASGPSSGTDGATPSAWTARFTEQFFKTKICSFWQKGLCMRGTACKYAHGDHELNQMPDLTKTALCHQMLAYGKCNDRNCRFAHSSEDLRATGNFYKTTMCSFNLSGKCSLGEYCRHAHNVQELRNAQLTRARGARMHERMTRISRMAMHRPLAEEEEDDLGEVPPWTRTMSQPVTKGVPSQQSQLGPVGPTHMVREDSFDDSELGEVPPWVRTMSQPVQSGMPLLASTVSQMQYQQQQQQDSFDDSELGEEPPWVRTMSQPVQSGVPLLASPMNQMRYQQQQQQQQQDSDDELGPVPAWTRTMSQPVHMMGAPSRADGVNGQQGRFRQDTRFCPVPFQPLQRTVIPQTRSVVDEDEEDFDNCDMWFRMQSMPAPANTCHPEALEGQFGGCSVTASMRSLTTGTLPAMCGGSACSSTDQWSRQVSIQPEAEVQAAAIASPNAMAGNPAMAAVSMPSGTPIVLKSVQLVQVPMAMLTTEAVPMQQQVIMNSPDTALMKQLEAKLLESAMPEHYED